MCKYCFGHWVSCYLMAVLGWQQRLDMGIETACKNQGGAVPCVVTILLYTRSSAGLKAVNLIEIET